MKIGTGDGLIVFAMLTLFLVFIAPTAIAVIRGVDWDVVPLIVLFSVLGVGLPAAYLLAFGAPGRERPSRVVRGRPLPPGFPANPLYPLDPRYPPSDPRARYPLP